MRFNLRGDDYRIKIPSIMGFDNNTQTIFFNVLTEKNSERKIFKELFINLNENIYGKVFISTDHKFTLRVNNYIPSQRRLEIKVFTIKKTGAIYREGLYIISLDFKL